MKIGTIKKHFEKIIIITLIIFILTNLIVPITVKAKDKKMEDAGGVLFEPVQKFLTFIADSALWLLQSTFLGDDSSVVKETLVTVIETNEEGEETKVDRRISMPSIKVSPEAIFSNKIPAFDINFFKDFSDDEEELDVKVNFQFLKISDIAKEYEVEELFLDFKSGNYKLQETRKEYEEKLEEMLRENKYYEVPTANRKIMNIYGDFYISATGIPNQNIDGYAWMVEKGNSKYDIYEAYIHAGGEGSGVIGLYEYVIHYDNSKASTKQVQSSAKILQPVVSYWYNVFRNISVIGLLSVLLYVGIRIVTSTVSSKKSKYLEMLKDCLVAICLIFFMHYFMSFVITITGSIAQAMTNDYDFNASQQTLVERKDEEYVVDYYGDKLIGNARIQLESNDFSSKLTYTIIYIVLTIYTIIFAVIYLKRVIYMAFFTIIAPLVALTYPLDKIRDGKAQAFDYWMKEYIFNALIQPVHLILYVLLVGSALDLATTNPIYSLIAIGFLIPAEKIVRSFFGFDQASTAGALGGALSGALAMQGINALKKKIGGAGNKGKDGKAEKDKNDKPVRTADSGNNTGSLMSDIAGQNGQNGQDNQNNQDEASQNGGEHDNGNGQEEQENNGREGQNNFQDSQEENGQNNEGQDEQNGDGQNNQTDEENDGGKAVKAKALTVAKIAGKGLKFAGKTLLRGYGAATLGTLGIAAGLASEKYSNVFSYGLGGVAAGKMAADAGMKFVGKTLPSTAYRIKKGYEGIRDESEKQIYTKKERAKIANERADNAFRRDPDAKKQFKHAFGKDNYEAAMEAAINYRKYGITDNDTIIKAMQLNSQGLGSLDDKKRILTAKLAPQVKNEKDIEQIEKRLRSNGFTNAQIENMKAAMRKYNDMG